jgi:hypothetical protein
VFRTTKWYRLFSAFAALALGAAGTFSAVNGTALWHRAGGAALAAFGLAGLADVLISRIVLDRDSIHVISLVRRRRHPRSAFESAKVDGGAVCMKKRDGGWLVLPDTGRNALSIRNSIHAWIQSGASDGKKDE